MTRLTTHVESDAEPGAVPVRERAYRALYGDGALWTEHAVARIDLDVEPADRPTGAVPAAPVLDARHDRRQRQRHHHQHRTPAAAPTASGHVIGGGGGGARDVIRRRAADVAAGRRFRAPASRTRTHAHAQIEN